MENFNNDNDNDIITILSLQDKSINISPINMHD